MPTPISNFNAFTGYKVQPAVLPDVQQKEDSSQKPVDDKVTISQKEGALNQGYTRKKFKLEQTYENESQKLEREYLQEKERIEKEFRRKKMALGLDLYA